MGRLECQVYRVAEAMECQGGRLECQVYRVVEAGVSSGEVKV